MKIQKYEVLKLTYMFVWEKSCFKVFGPKEANWAQISFLSFMENRPLFFVQIYINFFGKNFDSMFSG